MMLEMFQKPRLHSFNINSHQNSQTMAESRGVGEKTSQDCWSLMTRVEKVLLFLLILSLVLLLALSVFVIVHFLQEQNCDTPECIEASYKLLKTVDFTVDPCVDFRRFVCGNSIPCEDERKADLITTDLQEDDSPNLKTAKLFYQACINATLINEDNENALSTLVSRLDGWPLLLGDKWKEDNFNWPNFLVQVRPRGVKSDWLFSFDYHEENGTNLLLINPPKLRQVSYEHKSDYYERILAQLGPKLGAGSTQWPTQGQLNGIMQFEAKLYNISKKAWKTLTKDRIEYTHRSISELNVLCPENLLVELLNGLAHGYSVFTNTTIAVVASEKYLYDLADLLGRTPKRTQANYFIWKTIESYLPFSSDDIREIYQKYFDLPNREENCHAETMKRFYSVVEDEYVRRYKSKDTLKLLNTTVEMIYQSYNKSEEAKVIVKIEGPAGKNSGVTIRKFESHKIINIINEIEKHVENEFYRCLYRNADSCVKEGYYDKTQELETFYDTNDNTIHLPYNLVYSDSFMWDQPNYINFAKIGRIIGDKIIEAEEEKYNTTINKQGVNIAYEGYMKWLQKEGMDKKLPVLNYSIKQLFWIYSSHSFCPLEHDSRKFDQVTQSQYFKTDFEC